MTRYRTPGSPAELLARAELRAKLKRAARELWSEQLEKLVADARLLRMLGHPLPRDPVTVASVLPKDKANAEGDRKESADPNPG
jgi:hypothetical protein